MHHPVDHVLALILTVLFPLRAALFGFRRLQRCPPEQLPALRRKVYRDAIAIQWGLVAAVFGLWIAYRRPWLSLGLELRVTPGLLAVLGGCLLVGVLLMRQRAEAMRDDKALGDLRRRMSRLEVMLPHTPEEYRRFMGLGITAGVCEEILYRGYMIWYLSGWMDLLPAAAVSAVIFGAGHAYQGMKGVLQTGILGAFLAAVYLVSGSIYACMLIHVLMDLHSGHLMMKAYVRRTEQERDGAAESGWLDEGGAPGSAPEPEPGSAGGR